MNRLTVPPNDRDHCIGSLRSPVLLVEYGDFECPHCAAAVPVFERLISDFRHELCFVYRHFPVTMVHPRAEYAGVAAEAAAIQGGFWDMHHLLFENQDALSEEGLAALAQALKLDLQKFEKDFHRESLREKVREDFRGGVRSGVNGTPGIFLNGLKYSGTMDYLTLKLTIQQELEGGRSAMW